eukprot:CAMPEP_0114257010 /NCGR_PEP_ID=MMETSP0058-20121206/18484_1 /TAXON_ID=36894 /ORGANISM="Pyramimonas parkeae, CCMP726" /LENGTH=350 /DNA_ID=CAMNT_0001371667 /DNA_START=417 /DNA_END=1469 /DNA_ORIENTATION=-
MATIIPTVKEADAVELQPLFKFGLISDTQYVDGDDATNFPGTRTRRYRHSLQVLERAVKSWNQEQQSDLPISFVVQLGDAIDGKCASMSQSVSAAEDLQRVISDCVCSNWHFCIGNHEMYNFSTVEWVQRMFPPEQTNSYYDFSPCQGWRVVILNSYEVCLMAPEDSPERAEALRILQQNNPNDVIAGSDWFKGVEGFDKRFVPYNGQFSTTQLQWFAEVLQSASDNKERVIVACHQPCYIGCTNFSNLPFNYEETLKLVHSFPGVVVAWIAGHDHDGGYAIDEMGVHHMVPAAPLECVVGEDAFGHVEVLPDDRGLRVVWSGKLPVKGQWPEILECPPLDSNLQLASSL